MSSSQNELPCAEPLGDATPVLGATGGRGPRGDRCAAGGSVNTTLLNRARGGDEPALAELLERYRNYLMLLATVQITDRLRTRTSPSDIVQETMLRAHQNFGRFRGDTQPQFVAWLRKILVNNLMHSVEHHVLAAKRDVRREVSIEQIGAALDQSTVQFANVLADQVEGPSSAAQRHEDAVILSDRLASLPAHYRQVLVMRHLHGLSFDDIAPLLDRTPGATRMLWLRAIDKLRELYRSET
ncbi:MAG: sigma-70 family RNA polymerase sigma factor [Pirellulales bacterium]